MLDSIIYFSVKNKLIIGLLVVGLIAWGLFSLSRLPVDAVPDITNNQVQVLTISPALSAQEVERFITAPLELSFANIPGQTEIRSVSRSGLSVITVVFRDDVDLYRARQLVGEQIKIAQQSIPPDAGVPDLAPITTGLGEIYQYVIEVLPGYEQKYNLSDLRTIQDWIIKRQLAGTEGIAEVSSFGGFEKQYEISFDPERLRSMNVSIQELMNAVDKNNENTGGSYIEKNHNAYFIRGEGMVTDLGDIENIVIRSEGSVPLLIRDVAHVQFGHAVRYGAMSKNGEEVVGGIVLMLKGSNSKEVISKVEERIRKIQKTLPEGLRIDPYLNRADLIGRAIHTVQKNLIEGGLIVIFVLVLVLGNLRAGFVVASVIPLSLLFAFSMMHLFGVSANLMSLGAVDFGLVVDGAVIIVEAIVHQLTIKAGNNRLVVSQEEMDETVFQSTVRIRQSAAFGEIIILMVYLPILVLSGIEGKMFRPMAQTVGFAILGALILSLTYVPMIASVLLSKKVEVKKTRSEKVLEYLYEKYAVLLLKALNRRWIFAFLAFGLLAASAVIFNQLGGEFLPSLEEGNFAVDTRLSSGSALTQTIESFGKAEKIINQFPEVKEVVGRIGSSEIPTDPMPMEVGDLMIILKDKDEWTSAESMDELSEKMKDKLSVLPGIQFEFLQPIQMRTNELISGVRADVGIKIFGDDLQLLFNKAGNCHKLIEKVEGITDLKIEQIQGLPQMVVKYDRKRIAQYGLDIKTLNSIIRTSFAGQSAGIVYEKEKRFELVIRMDEKFRRDISDLGNIFVDVKDPVNGMTKVPLQEVAEISYQDAPIQISRENSNRRVSVTFNVHHRDVESVVEEIQEILNRDLKLPPGYYYTIGGQFENLIEAKQRLYVAVPVALLIIFTLLYFTFHSVKETILIFTAIPLSAIGGILALWMRGMYFSISAGVGFIALFGVAVLNGIVLISSMNHLKAEGITDVKTRIIQSTKDRFRPVLLTALVASLGFLPMAISTNAGAEVQRPLATVVIGGLISATFLTLIILPVLYSLVYDRRNNVSGKSILSISLILFFALLSVPEKTAAQNSSFSKSLDEVIRLGIQNNLSVQASGLLVQEQKALVKSAFDIPKTMVEMQYGKVQDPEHNDYTITAIQQFAFPTYYSAQRNLIKDQVNLAEKKVAMEKRSLVASIKIAYYRLLFTNQLFQLLKDQDSIYTEAQRVAELKYRTGESSHLESIVSLSRLQEIRNRLEMLQNDRMIQKLELGRLLHISPDSLDVDYTSQFIKSPTFPDSAGLTEVQQHPGVGYLQQQTAISKRLLALEKQRLLPSVTAGYFNQTISHVPNNQGFYAGLGVPLWFGANNSRIQAAKVFLAATRKQLENNLVFYSSEYLIQWQQYRRYQKSLNYYNTTALPQAAEIQQNAYFGYTRGELDYVEFAQAVTQSWQIRESYLNTVIAFDQAVIQLESFTEKYE